MLTSFIVITIAYIISGFILIENIFITFSSLESAFKYTKSGNIKMIVSGETTSMVLSENKNIKSYTIFPKTDKGWKLGTGIEQKNIITKNVDFNTVFVYNYKDTSDYYVVIWDISESTPNNTLKISDNRGSIFKSLSNNEDVRNATYVAYVSNLGDDYEININGKKVKLE